MLDLPQFDGGFAAIPARHEQMRPNGRKRRSCSPVIFRRFPAGVQTLRRSAAALFHDLIDSNNEGNDRTTYPARYVMTVFKTCRTTAGKRETVAAFVWCVENRIDRKVHEDSFRGIAVPTTAGEFAEEPSDWNADDIRSTWLQNVG